MKQTNNQNFVLPITNIINVIFIPPLSYNGHLDICNNAQKGILGLPPPVKLERCHMTYTVSV
jgi:hypothetical protein